MTEITINKNILPNPQAVGFGNLEHLNPPAGRTGLDIVSDFDIRISNF